MVAGDAYSMYAMSKMGLGAFGYIASGSSLLLALGLLYGAIVEGYTLAYIIIAWGVLNVLRGLYYGVYGRSWMFGGVSLAFGALFVYWGYQRLQTAQMMVPSYSSVGGRRMRRR